MRKKGLVITFALGLGLALALLGLVGSPATPASAVSAYQSQQPSAEVITVCPGGGCDHASLQSAVDAANDGDLIKVATGTYTDLHARPVSPGYPNPPVSGLVTQVVYISKTLTIRGGYTAPDFGDPPNPETNPTTLDAQGQGRVLFIAGPISPTLEGLRLTGGNARALGGVSGYDAGGGVYVVTATVDLSDSLVIGNIITTTAGQGGGLYFDHCPDVALTGCTVSDNKASPLPDPGVGGWGGGILFKNSPRVTLHGNIVSDNRASWGGGLHFQNSPTATLTANTISNNIANHSGGGMKHFGGVHFLRCDNVTLIGNTISGNETANDCAGVCFDDSDNAELIDNDVVDNLRSAGFRGYGVGLFIRNSQNASLVGNVIGNNTSKLVSGPGTILGGGLFVQSSDVSLVSNRIVSNGATRGGGLYAGSNSNLALTANVITGNIVYDASGDAGYDPVGYGGGLYLNNSTATMTNSIVADNQADVIGHGSGLYIKDSPSKLWHTTIAGNHGADGSGLYIAGSGGTVALTNTILVSHTTGITVAAGNTATLNGVLWWGNTDNTGGDGSIDVTQEHTGPPAFVDPSTGDYHIKLTSAAVDSGVETVVGSDIDGDPRPQGSGYDLGADETGVVVLKQANADLVQSGTQLTYTLRLTNTSDVDLHATVTDVLPTQVTPTGHPTWTPIIPAGGGFWEQKIPVTVELGYAGTLTNVMRVTTDEGARGVYTHTSTAEEPIAGLVASSNSPTPLNSPTRLTATITAGSNVTYTWALGDGATDRGAITTHTYPAIGTYTAAVTARNPVSEFMTETTVIVEEPLAGLVASNNSPTPLGRPTRLTATITAGSNVTYTWAFGDGAAGSGAIATHTYPAIGIYTAEVAGSNRVSELTATTTITIPKFTFYLPLVWRTGL